MRIRELLIGAFAALLVVGPSYAQLQGTVIAGENSSSPGTKKNVAVDSTGRLLVVGSASGSTVYGPDAIGAAGTQPPVRIGGSATNVTGGTINSVIVSSAGSAQVQGGLTTGSSLVTGGFLVGGSDGTNYRNLSTNTSGVLNINPASVVGSATPTFAQPIGITDGTNLRIPITVSGLGDGGTGGSTLATGPFLYNGSGYDRWRSAGTTGFAAIASGATGSAVPGSAVFMAGADASGGQLRGIAAMPTNADSITASSTVNALRSISYPVLFNGSSYDRASSINAGTGIGIAAVALSVNSSSGAASTPTASTAVEGSHVFKASAGNLYRMTVTTGAVGGYLMVFNATSAPADGAVTPLLCRAVGANSSLEVDHTPIPDRYSTGVTAVFSTTGCFTKTVSATAMFEGNVH